MQQPVSTFYMLGISGGFKKRKEAQIKRIAFYISKETVQPLRVISRFQKIYGRMPLFYNHIIILHQASQLSKWTSRMLPCCKHVLRNKNYYNMVDVLEKI